MNNTANKNCILIVDDDLVNMRLASAILSKHHYNIINAQDGVQAVEFFKDNKHDIILVFMDLKMPGINGIEATQKIRKLGFNDVPIIALTSEDDLPNALESLNSGMNDFLTKPYTEAKLRQMAKKWCEREQEG
jgi:CheY-like chemotaxis protein